jgi:hypothetical protein
MSGRSGEMINVKSDNVNSVALELELAHHGCALAHSQRHSAAIRLKVHIEYLDTSVS